jgi:hypothetical protein
MSTQLDHAQARWRKRWIAIWILVSVFGMSLFFISQAPWYKRLLGVLVFQVWIGGWFLLLGYVQAKAAAKTPEAETFRGPMPPWRVGLWTCVAAVGVFWFGTDHSWRAAVFAALFCAVTFGGFFFTLNWLAGDRGKAWSRKHLALMLSIYTLALSASALLKFLEIVFRKP